MRRRVGDMPVDDVLRRHALAEELPAHDWLLTMNVPITLGELKRWEDGQRVVFRKLDPHDESQVRHAGVWCARCLLAYAAMSERERQGCRG